MKEQATCPTPRPVTAETTRAPREQVVCSMCRGTGALGAKHELRAFGTSTIVLTQTQWCPACQGLGVAPTN